LPRGVETDRSQHRSIPLPVENQVKFFFFLFFFFNLKVYFIYKKEPESDGETSHEPDSKSLKRSESESTIKTTNKTYTKSLGNNGLISHRSTTTAQSDRSSAIRPSEEEDEDVSDFEISAKQKKTRRYPKYDSSAQATTTTEESETDDQQSTRMRYRDTDDDLFTVREEKTLESMEGARYKKR
jgi:hypothetical protein